MMVPKLSKRHARRVLLSSFTLLTVLVCLFSNSVATNSGSLARMVAPYVGVQPAIAQRLDISDIAETVYQTFPELPRENDYIDVETGEVDQDNTLVSRFIRYHLYVARRLPTYRLDWKLTFADYLGVHDWIRSELYPGSNDLRDNPRDGDIEVIGQLNRAERDALVDALVAAFSTEGTQLPGYGIGY